MAFCRLTSIPFELKTGNFRKGEHLSKEFEQINPVKQIPAMVEIDTKTGAQWRLAESCTIIKYLALTRKVADHWYPADIKQRILIDQYIDWHHTFLR